MSWGEHMREYVQEEDVDDGGEKKKKEDVSNASNEGMESHFHASVESSCV